MPTIPEVRADLVGKLAANVSGVTVTGDPRQLVPPCVFVDLVQLTERLAMGTSWTGSAVVHIIAPADPDQVGIDWLDAIAQDCLAVLGSDVTSLAGQPFVGLPGTTGLPEYALTVEVTADY
jgi:hypothetical protein